MLFEEENLECVLGYTQFEVLWDISVEMLSRYKDIGLWSSDQDLPGDVSWRSYGHG